MWGGCAYRRGNLLQTLTLQAPIRTTRANAAWQSTARSVCYRPISVANDTDSQRNTHPSCDASATCTASVYRKSASWKREARNARLPWVFRASTEATAAANAPLVCSPGGVQSWGVGQNGVQGGSSHRNQHIDVRISMVSLGGTKVPSRRS
jgi:hypothetical protein